MGCDWIPVARPYAVALNNKGDNACPAFTQSRGASRSVHSTHQVGCSSADSGIPRVPGSTNSKSRSVTSLCRGRSGPWAAARAGAGADGWLARVRATERHEPDPGTLELVDAIPRRHTDRRPFSSQPVDAITSSRQAHQQMVQGSAAADAHLTVVRVGHGEALGCIQEEFDGVAVQPPGPGLGVVQGRSVPSQFDGPADCLIGRSLHIHGCLQALATNVTGEQNAVARLSPGPPHLTPVPGGTLHPSYLRRACRWTMGMASHRAPRPRVLPAPIKASDTSANA